MTTVNVHYKDDNFDIEWLSSDSFGNIKSKCIAHIIGSSTEQREENFTLLIHPKDEAGMENTFFDGIHHLVLQDAPQDAPQEILNLQSDAYGGIADPNHAMEYPVVFEEKELPIRVLAEDSLATFMQKIKDAFWNVDVGNIASIHQTIRDDKIFIYDADSHDPKIRDKRRTMEHLRCEFDSDFPLIVSERESTSECPIIHFLLNDDDYTQFDLNPEDNLDGVMQMLLDKNQDSKIFDLRVKSRSLYNKAKASENASITLGACGLTGGDVIEVVTERTCPSYLSCKLLEAANIAQEVEDITVSYGKGRDVKGWKSAILEEFERPVDGERHVLFECVIRDDTKYLRALYDSEELSRSVAFGNDDHYLVLWRNCEYVEIKSKDDIVRITSDFKWPWGNKNIHYWTYGLRFMEKSDSNERHYLVRTTDGGFANIRKTDEYANKKFNPRKSAVPGTPIAAKSPRNVSMFVAFFTEKPEMNMGYDKKMLLMSRNHNDGKPLSKGRKNAAFWISNK